MSCNTHSFNVGLAKKYGFGCAVLLQHFYFWTEKNRHDKDMVAGGFVWFYTSRRQMAETFPYLSEQNIRTCINKMLEAHLIMIGEDMIKAPYNTTVYALAPLGLALFEDEEDQLVKSTNQLAETTNSKDSKKESLLSIEEKRRILAEKCEPYVAQYGRQMVDAFVSYWGEANGNRLRCEIAKQKSGAFEISRRLATWASKEYNQPRKPVTPPAQPRQERPIWESLGMTREQYLKMQGK